MDKSIEILKDELASYAQDPVNGVSFLTINKDQKVFAVVSVSELQGKRGAGMSLLVRLIGDCIVIERDMNNKPLVDALVQRGVPRDRIVLAYAGETVEEEAA